MGKSIQLIDFFAGCGGTSVGFRQSGIHPVAAIDNDLDASATYERNIAGAKVFKSDIRKLSSEDIRPYMSGGGIDKVTLFAGCAPCQPFSKQNRLRHPSDDRIPLLQSFQAFVEELRPDLIFIENVPGLQRVAGADGPLEQFVASIQSDYHIATGVVSSATYGVPQTRSRFVLLASRLGPITIPPPTYGPGTRRPYSSVRNWIADLPEIEAGESHGSIPSHSSWGLSDLNLKRIRATPEGGSRRDWPANLRLQCHSGEFGGHTDVYGRLSWDGLAPALTTRCISYSNGRFGHPTQDRAISVREAASLQTFPRSFIFTGNLTSQAKQIGNAVPVRLARRFGYHLQSHVRSLL